MVIGAFEIGLISVERKHFFEIAFFLGCQKWIFQIFDCKSLDVLTTSCWELCIIHVGIHVQV